MSARVAGPQRVELSVAEPDNLMLIENREDGVVIRAARDNFSPRQKLFFIRHLAAEGYIPERHGSTSGLECGSRLLWVVDSSWVGMPLGWQRKAMNQVGYAVLCAVVMWLALMSYAVFHTPS